MDKLLKIMIENDLRDIAKEIIDQARWIDDPAEIMPEPILWCVGSEFLDEELIKQVVAAVEKNIGANSYPQVTETVVRDKFYWIINGPGICIPRIAVKVALDDIFGKKQLGNPGMRREMISDTTTAGERPVNGNLVAMQIRCNGCGRLLMSIECDPAANAIGILVCPGCKEESMFDVTDMMAGLERV